jgi:hypothetical protein
MAVTLTETIVLNLHDAFCHLLYLLHLLDQMALALLIRLVPVEELQRLLKGVTLGSVQAQVTAKLLLFLGVMLLTADLVIES